MRRPTTTAGSPSAAFSARWWYYGHTVEGAV
jgi:hypothetical protein